MRAAMIPDAGMLEQVPQSLAATVGKQLSRIASAVSISDSAVQKRYP